MKSFFGYGKYSAFTLIELLIVIVIIGILGSITLNFSRQNIDHAIAQNEKEKFVSRYNNQLIALLDSKRYNEKEYKYITIDLQKNTNRILKTINFVSEKEPIVQDPYIFQHLQVYSKNRKFDNVQIYLEPYSFDCKIRYLSKTNIVKQSNPGTFALKLPQSSVIYCFTIELHTCKLKEIGCEGPLLN